MESIAKSKQIMAEIRDFERLKHLRRRPRCADGTLDRRYKVNKSFNKGDDTITDYYDPKDPSKNVPQAVIQQLQDHQQKEYDDAKFGELNRRYQRRMEEVKLRYEQILDIKRILNEQAKKLSENAKGYVDKIRALENKF